MTVIGVLFGFLAASSASVSYLCSRLFVLKRPGQGALQLLVLAHAWMGAASLLGLVLLWNDQVPPVTEFFWPLLGNALSYFIAQAFLFGVLKHVDASRVSPLLGLKIVILAAITAGLGQHLTGGQWAAALLAVFGGLLLRANGSVLTPTLVLMVLATCLFYSLSDLCIVYLVADLQPLSRVRASLLGVCMSYVICALVVLPMLGRYGSRRWSDWRDAAPFATVWLLSMIGIFSCFAFIGVVFGNIIQSTRGLISVGLGAVVARGPLAHLEQRVSRQVFTRRVIAALLMSAAIGLFVLTRPG